MAGAGPEAGLRGGVSRRLDGRRNQDRKEASPARDRPKPEHEPAWQWDPSGAPRTGRQGLGPVLLPSSPLGMC